MPVLKRIGIAASLVAATTVSIALSVPAHADTAAQPRDVVGVGSDTLQNVADFLFDGAPGVAGGYNSVGNVNRVENVFSTGDANGRAIFDGTCGPANSTTGLGTACQSTSNLVPNNLASSVILRAGQKPVVRPNGSGAGVSALIADDGNAGTTYQGLPAGSIQFARMSRLPNSTEEGNCPVSDSTCGGLHVYQVATDQLQIAHDAASYNGPAGLSKDELYKIFVTCQYTKWSDIPGYTPTTDGTIHPLIPQSGSGTRAFFLADLQAAEGLSSLPTPGACTRTVQEHDPTGIYADPTPADAIEPFSAGKIALINSGYFANAGYKGTAGNAYTPGFLDVLKGAAPDAGTNYDSTRGVYFVIRNADLSDPTPFQQGGTENWANALFAGPNAWIGRASNAALIQAAGFTPAYVDCGLNPTSC